MPRLAICTSTIASRRKRDLLDRLLSLTARMTSPGMDDFAPTDGKLGSPRLAPRRDGWVALADETEFAADE